MSLQEKPVIFISTTIGWNVRNFFNTGIIKKLQKNFKIIIFTTQRIKEELIKQGYDRNLIFIVLDKEKEPLRWRLFRQLKKKVYMESRKSETESLWEKYRSRPFYQKFGGWLIKRLIRIIKPITLFNFIETIDFKINKNKELSKTFFSYDPVMFFATHASTYPEELLLRSSIMHKVPTVHMVLSWDHLSSKTLLTRKYDSIFVWNHLTKSEILQTYPSYKEEQIKIVGAPQFDIYHKKPNLSYSQWCNINGLDPNRRTILFTTAPNVRHEQQHIIIEQLLEKIIEGKVLPKDLQTFIKCHPFDTTREYDSFLRKYPVAIYRPSDQVNDPQTNWVPSQDEISIARDCLYFCDININIFSTVTLEAAFLNKPIIHIAFDPFPVKNRIPCKEYYNFTHFKRIVNMDASILVYSYDELFEAINKFLQNPNLKSEGRKKISETFFGTRRSSASDRVVEELVNLGSSFKESR